MGKSGCCMKVSYTRAKKTSLNAIDMMHKGVYPFKKDEHGLYPSGNSESLFPDAIVPEGVLRGS